MIFVGGVPFSNSSSSKGHENLDSLLEHPILVSSANSFKAISERKVSVSENLSSEGSSQVNHVYVFQREYATVDPSLVEFVGTDEATTCVGLVIRNRRSGMTSVAHLDSPEVVDSGLDYMLSLVVNHDSDAELDVHLIGGYEDASYEGAGNIGATERQEKMGGRSLRLCSEIVQALHCRRENFLIQTLCVLRHNTRRDSSGNSLPVVNGFLVETSTGLVVPATFDRSSRCPDEIVRRVRVTVSSEDPNWKGRLLETYVTRQDRFQIAPCSWFPSWKYFAFEMQQWSDSKILLSCSTSPSAENTDFVENERRLLHLDTQRAVSVSNEYVAKQAIHHMSKDIRLFNQIFRLEENISYE